jgi:hypothetical protein
MIDKNRIYGNLFCSREFVTHGNNVVSGSRLLEGKRCRQKPPAASSLANRARKFPGRGAPAARTSPRLPTLFSEARREKALKLSFSNMQPFENARFKTKIVQPREDSPSAENWKKVQKKTPKHLKRHGPDKK